MCGRRVYADRVQSGADPIACVHRGEATGEIAHCRTCGSRSGEVAVYHCELHQCGCVPRIGAAVAGKPRWSGPVCLTCEDRTPA